MNLRSDAASCRLEILAKQSCAVLCALLYHVARMATPWGGKLIFWFVNDTKLSAAHPGWMLDAALNSFGPELVT